MQLRRAVFGLFVGAIGATSLVSACATSAELGDDDDTNPLVEAGTDDTPPKSDGSASPPKGSSSSSGGKSSSSSSSSGESSGGNGTSSGGSSSGSPALAEGAACDEPGKVYTRSCGLCGKQTATCFPGATVADQVVTPYSECTGEVEDGCAPGSTEPAAPCGYCGTQTRTCSNTCKWTNGTCTNPQTSSAKCMAGDTKIEGLGCPAGQYLTWTCRAGDSPADPNRCTWLAPPVSQCSAPVFPFVNAPALNATTTRPIAIADQTEAVRPNYNCTGSTAARWRAITEIRNTTAATIKVDVWTPDGKDRIIAAYDTPPVSDAAIIACDSFNDTCGYDTDLADLADACFQTADGEGLTIPANGKIWVLSANYGAIAAAAYDLSVKRVP